MIVSYSIDTQAAQITHLKDAFWQISTKYKHLHHFLIISPRILESCMECSEYINRWVKTIWQGRTDLPRPAVILLRR